MTTRRTPLLPRLLLLLSACLAASAPVWSSSAIESERQAARLNAYAQLANHNLLQITLLVPKDKANLRKSADGSWRLAGEVLCIDVAPLREEIETHEVRELPDAVRKHPIPGADFYRAMRSEPPRLAPLDQDRDFDADLNAAFGRFVTAKLVKKVATETRQGTSGCAADVVAVPAIRFLKKTAARATPSAWLERMERGELGILGVITIADLRAARTQRLSDMADEHTPSRARSDSIKTAPVPVAEAVYGALRVETGRFATCYVQGDDPLPALVAWTIADSDKVKRWMNAAAEAPKMLADLDAVVTELRKGTTERQCTVLVAPTVVLAKVKAALERDRFVVAIYPETASAQQVLTAFGFRSVAELKFARDIGIDSGEQFAPLRSLGLDTRDGYDQALRRYSWSYGSARADHESLAAFVRDEREAAAKGTTVKALRAERAKRAEEKTRKLTAAAR